MAIQSLQMASGWGLLVEISKDDRAAMLSPRVISGSSSMACPPGLKGKTFMEGLLKAIFVTGLASVLACGSQHIKQDYAPLFDFDQFKTYDWLEPSKPVKQLMKTYPALDTVVTSAVNRSMQKKGFRETTGKTDFLLDYNVILEEAATVRTWGARYGQKNTTKIEPYEKGTLIIDVLEPESMELIWRGSAEGAIVPDRTEEQRREAINEVVNKILKDFPPQ